MTLFHAHHYGLVLDKRYVSFSIWAYMGRNMKGRVSLEQSALSKNIRLSGCLGVWMDEWLKGAMPK
jgi:hypothetical protein